MCLLVICFQQCDLDRHRVARAKGRSRSCEVHSLHRQHLQTGPALPEGRTGAGMKGMMIEWASEDNDCMPLTLVHVHDTSDSLDKALENGRTGSVDSGARQLVCNVACSDGAQFGIGNAPDDTDTDTDSSDTVAMVTKATVCAATNNPACSPHALNTAASVLTTDSVHNPALLGKVCYTPGRKASGDALTNCVTTADRRIVIAPVLERDVESNAVAPPGERLVIVPQPPQSAVHTSVTMVHVTSPSQEHADTAAPSGESSKERAGEISDAVTSPVERLIISPESHRSDFAAMYKEDRSWAEKLTGMISKQKGACKCKLIQVNVKVFITFQLHNFNDSPEESPDTCMQEEGGSSLP